MDIYNYMENHVATTIIQIITIPIYALTFWFKRKDKQLISTILSCVFFALGYLFLVAWAGTIIAISTSIILYITYKFRKSNLNFVKLLSLFLVAVIINILLNLSFDNSLISWMAIIAGVLNYFNYIFLDPNLYLSKIFFLLSHVLLIIYEYIVGLPLFALVDIFAFISMLASFIILIHKKKSSTDKT